jgi:hypothetical protein
MKYPIVKDGEWVWPIMEGYKMSCCDCGLVHKVDFKITDGKIWLKMSRDYRATAAIRREIKKRQNGKATEIL